MSMTARVSTSARTRFWWASAVALLSLAALASPVHAQPFDNVVTGALDNFCSRLGGPFGIFTPKPLGPNLARLCPLPAVGPPPQGATSAAGGSVTVDTTRGAVNEDQRLLLYLKEKREQENQPGAPGASADSPTSIRGLGVFGSGNFERFDKDVTRFEPGYTSDNWGFTTGGDYRLDPRLLLGAAFNYSRINGKFDRNGGDFETESFGPLLYGSILPMPRLFVDVVAGYARKHYTVNRAVSAIGSGPGFPLFPTVIGKVLSDTDGNEYLAALHFGYDFHLGNVTIGPRGGVDYKYTTLDGFRERGSTGLELVYDPQHQTSLRTTVGAFASIALSTAIGVLVPQGTFEYLHEFENNQRAIYFRFSEDFGRRRFRFQTDPPDRDYFNLGGGLVVVLPGGVSPFINYRALVGYRNQSSHAVNLGFRVEF